MQDLLQWLHACCIWPVNGSTHTSCQRRHMRVLVLPSMIASHGCVLPVPALPIVADTALHKAASKMHRCRKTRIQYDASLIGPAACHITDGIAPSSQNKHGQIIALHQTDTCCMPLHLAQLLVSPRPSEVAQQVVEAILAILQPNRLPTQDSERKTCGTLFKSGHTDCTRTDLGKPSPEKTDSCLPGGHLPGCRPLQAASISPSALTPIAAA